MKKTLTLLSLALMTGTQLYAPLYDHCYRSYDR